MRTSLLLLFAFFIQAVAKADPPEDGKIIFLSRCAACHNVNKQVTGPALAGVDQRRTIDWIINFVHSSQKVIRSGDTTALALYEKFNRVTMPDHPDLTEGNIRSIVDYIKAETKAITDDAPFAKPTHISTYYEPLSLKKDIAFFGAYIAAVIALVFVLLFCVRLNEYSRARKGD